MNNIEILIGALCVSAALTFLLLLAFYSGKRQIPDDKMLHPGWDEKTNKTIPPYNKTNV